MLEFVNSYNIAIKSYQTTMSGLRSSRKVGAMTFGYHINIFLGKKAEKPKRGKKAEKTKRSIIAYRQQNNSNRCFTSLTET